jgi:hypothetical protein
MSIFFGFVLAMAASPAFADKLCLKSTVNKRTLKVSHHSLIAPSCPRGYSALADISSFHGINLAQCRLVTDSCFHSAGANSCALSCAAGEFILQHVARTQGNGCIPDTGGGTLVYSQGYSNGLGAGLTFFTSSTCSYEAFMSLLCCPVG